MAATKPKEPQVTATIQPPVSPIVPGRGRGLRTAGGLKYLIHAAKWGNNVTNYEQAHSPACGILPFVSLHHVSAGLLGRGGDKGWGPSQQQEASPGGNTRHTRGRCPSSACTAALHLYWEKTPFVIAENTEESDTSFFQSAIDTALWQPTGFSLNIRINICGFGQFVPFLSR